MNGSRLQSRRRRLSRRTAAALLVATTLAAEHFRAAYEAAGGRVVAQVGHPEPTGDSYASELRAALSGAPDVVAAYGYSRHAEVFALLSAGREIDYQGASGSVDFDAAGDVATSIEVWRFAAGGIEPLFTRDAQQPYCDYTPAATATPYVPGLIVGADVLSPEGHRPDHGVHIRFTGGIGAVAEFETLRAAYPDSAVLDCRGGPAYRFEPRHDPNLAFMAYVPHVGEGRIESCAARAEVALSSELLWRMATGNGAPTRWDWKSGSGRSSPA